MINNISSGINPPDNINVIIEIPSHNTPVKYEFNNNILSVDRFISTSMQYPCNYGFIPQTLSKDNDPIDALTITPYSLMPGVLIQCRPIGILNMEDESGIDVKIITVPIESITRIYSNVKEVSDLPLLLIKQIKHFFSHYKDLEENKWVKVFGFNNRERARKEIMLGIKRLKNN